MKPHLQTFGARVAHPVQVFSISSLLKMLDEVHEVSKKLNYGYKLKGVNLHLSSF